MSTGGAAADVSVYWPDGFTTDRLRATPLCEDDAALFAALYADAATMAQVAAPLSAAAAARAFAAALRQMRRLPPAARYWRLEEGGEALGLLSLVADAERRTAETGLLLDSAGRTRGVAREALSALLPQVLYPGGLGAVWTRHRTGHGAAAGLMRHLRFEELAGEAGWVRWQMTAARWQKLAAEAGRV